VIKSTVNNDTCTPVYPFPKLMILTKDIGKDSPLIVLFKKEAEGTVMTRTHDWAIGGSDTNFAMHCFTEFHGTIQLENGA
jgi:hypothetical protein